jgi:hypothetical protein
MSADPTDVHEGATPEQHAAALTGVFTALVDAAQRFGLRPAAVDIASLYGNLSLIAQLPGWDTAGVDALAGAYGLPADDGQSEHLYLRCGPAVLDGTACTVTIYTGRPRGPVPAAGSVALTVPDTREVAPVTAAPVRVDSERAEQRPALAVAR